MKGRPSAFRRYCAFLLGLSLIFLIQALPAQISQLEQQKIGRIIGAKGAYIPDEGAYKFTLPREAATVVLDYQTLPATMGLNSWAAFSSAQHHGALLAGQLLLLAGVDPANLSVTTRRIFKNLGIEGASFHSLRHTAASWLVMGGVSCTRSDRFLATKHHA
jgi:integrase